MRDHILFHGTGGDGELTKSIHFDSISNLSDYTLCGVTMDYDPKIAGDWSYTSKPVNRRRYIDIVRLGKSIKSTEITKGKLKD